MTPSVHATHPESGFQICYPFNGGRLLAFTRRFSESLSSLMASEGCLKNCKQKFFYLDRIDAMLLGQLS